MPATTGPAERLLDTATELFARDGVRAVGIDAVLRAADVARASLYQNFGSKDGLVTAYLRRLDERDRAGYLEAVKGVEDPAQRILVVFDLAAIKSPLRNFRGCLYLNVATEFPDPEHPAAQVIDQHRSWLEGVWRAELVRLGAVDPDTALCELTVLYDGALAQSRVTRSIAPIQTARRLAGSRLAIAIA